MKSNLQKSNSFAANHQNTNTKRERKEKSSSKMKIQNKEGLKRDEIVCVVIILLQKYKRELPPKESSNEENR